MADLVTAFLSSAHYNCEREKITCSHLRKEVWAPSKKSDMYVLWFLDWNLKHMLWQSWVWGTPQTCALLFVLSSHEILNQVQHLSLGLKVRPKIYKRQHKAPKCWIWWILHCKHNLQEEKWDLGVSHASAILHVWHSCYYRAARMRSATSVKSTP